LSWRYVFYINIPVGIAAVIVTQIGLKFPDTYKGKKSIKSIDFGGIALLVSGLVLLLLGISFGGNQYAWNSAAIICLFVFGGSLLILFVINEIFWTNVPIIVMSQFKNKDISLCNITGFMTGAAMLGGISYLPLYFQVVNGDTPTISGLKLIPMMFGIIVGSIASGVVISKTGSYWQFPPLGTALTTVGFGVLYLLTVDYAYVKIAFMLICIGFGLGCLLQTLIIICQFSVDKKLLAISTATVNFLRTMGGVIGVQIFGSILTGQLNKNLSPELAGIAAAGVNVIDTIPVAEQAIILQAYCDALNILFVSATAFTGIAFFLSLGITPKRVPKGKPHPKPPQKDIEKDISEKNDSNDKGTEEQEQEDPEEPTIEPLGALEI